MSRRQTVKTVSDLFIRLITGLKPGVDEKENYSGFEAFEAKAPHYSTFLPA